jgi:cytochrome c1
VLFTYTTATFSSRPATDSPRRTLLRGVFDGRYKFARYFAVNEHHIPTDWKTLLAHNDLELYDTQTDPDEVNNLAKESQRHRSLILSLNAKINQLIATEVGADDGSIYPGETSQYQLKV